MKNGRSKRKEVMIMYKYFIPAPNTLEELKKQYRELAFTHHPDCGGSEKAMKAVNSEYDALFPKLKDTHRTRDGETYKAKNESSETADQFKDLINELMKMENIVVEVIGCFVWVSGNTKPYKETLKALRFRWHTKKFCWYLAPEDYRRRSQKDYDMDEIRKMYGSSGEMNSTGTGGNVKLNALTGS